MSEFPSRLRSTLRLEWIRYREQLLPSADPPLRAGVAGAYLPRLLLEVPHASQERLSDSVPQCVSMVMEYYASRGGTAAPGWAQPDPLADLLQLDEEGKVPGARLEWLRAWGLRADFPRDLQFFRDGALALNRRMAVGEERLVFRWEERWLRYVAAALLQGIPPILFVDLGRLYSGWLGLRQPHAVVLAGGDGRRAWIHDPSRREGPVRVGLCRLMDALLPGEPLAALLQPDTGVPGPSPRPGRVGE
jgi:hypothetical protein